MIGGHLLVVRDVLSATTVRVEFGGRDVLVTDQQREELMPQVFVSCGVSGRLAFEAPRSIRIERVP